MFFEEFNAMKETCHIMWLYEQIKNNYISCTDFLKKLKKTNGKFPENCPEYIFADYEYRDKWKEEHGTECPYAPGELLIALVDAETEEIVIESRRIDRHKTYTVRISEWIMDMEEGMKTSVVGGLEVKNDDRNETAFLFPFIEGFDFMESDDSEGDD